uniref:Capsid protein n=1 Tax=Pelargonium line pattern virus TaxID=167019 RepID=Q911J6_9TOMB|nr:coat protein [Pelargonium line pattern virus]
MAAKDNPAVIAAVARREQWAIKLQSKGWGSLSKAQKATARSYGIGNPPTVVVPRTTRLVAGNPTNARRARGEPGNAKMGTTITKQEYMGELHSSSKIETYLLDPKNVRSFPQLSGLAIGYNKYKITDFKVRYSPKCSDSGCGLTIAYSSDSSDPPPKNKFNLFSMNHKYETAAHKPLLVTLPVSKETRFLRDKCTDDSKLVDSGAVHVLVDGNHEGRLGELFFELTIVFSEPTFCNHHSQVIKGIKESEGPEYVKVEPDKETVKLVFQAAGAYLVSIVASKLERIGQLGASEGDKQVVESADKSACLCRIEAEQPGSAIVLVYASREAITLRAYINKL